MLKTDYEQTVNDILLNHSNDFDPIEDIETLAGNEKWNIIRTSKLLPTMLFMQRAWWRLYEINPDDEYDRLLGRVEYNILTYYKK